jgi:hypothetical protein
VERFSFLVNARPSTLAAGFQQRGHSGGVLFPPDRAASATVAALANRRTREFVLADNGAYDAIGDQVAALPVGTDDAEAIASLRAAAAEVDTVAQLSEQLAVRPQGLVGPEDITLASWLLAGVEESALVRRRNELRRRNHAVAQRGLAMQAAHPDRIVYTVASAHDHDTAFDAGSALGKSGNRAVAMGFGAMMADDSWTNQVKIHGRKHRLPRSLPQRYLRTALVARGFFAGWAASGAPPPARFHFLGLGAPIMLPLTAYAARRVDAVTYDATSPIKDAVEGTIYVSKPAQLKIRTWKVVERLATGDLARWSCPCSFCRNFCLLHPFDDARLSTLGRSRHRPFTAEDLHAGHVAAQAAPLFAIGPGPLSAAAAEARAGHNHWVIGTTLTSMSQAPDPRAAVDAHVASYVANAGAEHFGLAVELAWQQLRNAS